jgi:DNA-binding transcriptional MerR regulator
MGQGQKGVCFRIEEKLRVSIARLATGLQFFIMKGVKREAEVKEDVEVVISSDNADQQTSAKKNRTWSPDDDSLLISLRDKGRTFQEISESLDRPRTTCLMRFNMLMKTSVSWDKEMDQKLEKAYQKHRESMWKGVAAELDVPWRAAENRAWDLGKKKFVKG